MRYLPHTPDEVQAMLERIGVGSVDALFDDIPNNYRLERPLAIDKGIGEVELMRELDTLAGENKLPRASFLGGGMYDHHIPPAVDQLLLRSEFYTSYTPYQAEVAQGTLQSIFEFQTHMCLLTGLDVSNASLYEGASALVEALLMASRLTRGRSKAVLSAAIHPEYRETVRTYFARLGLTAVDVPIGPDGATDTGALEAAVDDDTFAVAVASPNFYGVVEDWEVGSRIAHGRGALSVAVVAEAVSMALLAPPGERGADIACGEAQSLGVPMHFGGPVLGFLTCRSDHQRQLPGRLVGETRDAEGRRAFCLTLSTREQHIRRERATSNICTNQGLMALAANIHCSLLGKRGLREVALQSHAKAEYLKGESVKVAGSGVPFTGPTFNEFAVDAPEPAAPLLARLARRGILAGVPLSRWEAGSPNRFLVATTEMNTREEMDRLVGALRETT